MNVIWTPLSEEELAVLKEGDPVVTHDSSKDAFQWHPSQRLHPAFYYIRDVKFVKRSKDGSAIEVLQEGDNRPIWVSAKEVGRFIDLSERSNARLRVGREALARLIKKRHLWLSKK